MKASPTLLVAIILAVAGMQRAAAQTDAFEEGLQEPIANPVSDAKVELAVLPTYPKRALRNGIDGEVTVRFNIARYGRAVDTAIVAESPRRVFRDAVLDALKYWYITPGRSGVCNTVIQSAEQTFRFRHSDPKPVQLLPIIIEGRAGVPRPELKVDAVGLRSAQASGLFSQVVDPKGLVATRRVDPEYPEKALERRREGFVSLSFLIEKDGSVSEPKVVEAERAALFKRPALTAIKQWRFEPTIKDGEPIERIGCHEFMFNLDARTQAQRKKKIKERTRIGNF